MVDGDLGHAHTHRLGSEHRGAEPGATSLFGAEKTTTFMLPSSADMMPTAAVLFSDMMLIEFTRTYVLCYERKGGKRAVQERKHKSQRRDGRTAHRPC